VEALERDAHEANLMGQEARQRARFDTLRALSGRLSRRRRTTPESPLQETHV